MEVYIKPFALTLLNKMALLRENIIILLRLQDHSCYLLIFQVSSWGKLFTTTHVVNQIPTSHNFGLSFFGKLYGYAPDCSIFHVFGCTYFILKPHVECTQLSTKSALCVFLGYGLSQKGYRCFYPISKKVYVSRHVCLEHTPFFSISARSHYLTTSNAI